MRATQALDNLEFHWLEIISMCAKKKGNELARVMVRIPDNERSHRWQASLDNLMEKGLVKIINLDGQPYHQITERGKELYMKSRK